MPGFCAGDEDLMSSTPHASVLGLCSASKTVRVVPWIDGVRRPEASSLRTVFCDKPSFHVVRPSWVERRHYDRSSGLAWSDDEVKEEME